MRVGFVILWFTTSIRRVWSAKMITHTRVIYLDTTDLRLNIRICSSIDAIIDNLNSKIGKSIFKEDTWTIETRFGLERWVWIKIFQSKIRLDYFYGLKRVWIRYDRKEMINFFTCRTTSIRTSENSTSKNIELKWFEAHNKRILRWRINVRIWYLCEKNFLHDFLTRTKFLR